ncbi:MAG: MFS transporter [Gemmatimonadetes bacterium]|nr:MFS transporter [Gemmatimonadota bacterium]
MKLPATLSPGMRTYSAVWFGQMVSMIGTTLTEFGVSVWVYQKTGSATVFAMILLFSVLPGILISPLAGPLVDRWDRRKTMVLADTGAALSTLSMALLLISDRLEVWHILVAVSFSAACRAFQGPAWMASTSLLVPEEHLGRASGMMSFARSAAAIAGPLLAGVLVPVIGLQGVVLIDFATFLVAVAILFAVRFPPTPRTQAAQAARGSLLKEAAFGWKYIASQPALRMHLYYFALVNMALSYVWALFPPLVLSFAGPTLLGTVGSALGFGMLVGSLLMTAWGGPQRKVLGILGYGVLLSVCLVLMGVRPWVPLVALSMFGMTLGMPILNGSFMRLWMPRIPPDVQGRTFAGMQVMVWSTQPIAYLTAGPLADRVFKPLLVEGGPLAGSLGAVFGVGPGRGIGLLLATVGVFVLVVTAVAAMLPGFRTAEEAVPVAVKPQAPAAAPSPTEDPAADPTPVPA